MAENKKDLKNDEQPTQETPFEDNKKELENSAEDIRAAKSKRKKKNRTKKKDKKIERSLGSGNETESENIDGKLKSDEGSADTENPQNSDMTEDAGISAGGATDKSSGNAASTSADTATELSKTENLRDKDKNKGFFSNFSSKPVKGENYQEVRKRRKENVREHARGKASQNSSDDGKSNLNDADVDNNQKAANFRAKISRFVRGLSRIMSRKNKYIALYLVALCLLFAIVTIVPSLSNAFSTTMSVEYGTLRISDEAECYVIKDETIYFANKNGDIDYNYEEGKIVRAGSEVVTLESASVEKASALGTFKDHADDFLSGETLYNTDKEALTNVIKDLQLAYDNETDESTASRINMYINRLTNLKNHDSEERKNDTDYSALGFQPETYEIVSPGYVSYVLDGYENELNPFTMTLLDKNKVSKIDDSNKNLKRSMTLKGEPLFKIVDNTGWYVTFWIDESDLGKYNAGSEVTLVLEDAEISAKVDSVVENDGEIQVILKSTEYYENLPTLRRMNIEIVTSDSSGLIIKNTFLTSKDDMTGVYVRNIDSSVEFRPVKVKSTDGEYSIVESGYFTVYNKETELTDQYKTVNVFDELVKPD